MPLTVDLIPCLADNYAVLLHREGMTALIDAPEAAPIEQRLEERGWKLTHCLITHHHHDHVDGLSALIQHYGCAVIANKADDHRIQGITHAVKPGERVAVGPLSFEVIDTPGHTVGHVAYYCAAEGLLFAGDTLFAGGCGRIFEGRPEAMWDALQRLAALPDETLLYCGHEYTLSNLRFGASIERDNAALQARLKDVEALRATGLPTVPSTLQAEKATNVFLRPQSQSIRQALHMMSDSDADVFAELRARKNKA